MQFISVENRNKLGHKFIIKEIQLTTIAMITTQEIVPNTPPMMMAW